MSELAQEEKYPTDIEKVWITISNLEDKKRLKISVVANEFEKVIFNRDPAIEQNNIGESHNITWVLDGSYNLAISEEERHSIEQKLSAAQAEIARLKAKLENRFKWLVRHSLLTSSISRAKAAELLEVPLIDLDQELDSIGS